MTLAHEPAATAAAIPRRQVTMTPDEAFAHGLQHHQAGDLAQARAVYEQVLRAVPGHLPATNCLGILKHQSGEFEDALLLLRQVVEQSPQADGAWNNLGNVLLELGRDEEAAQAFTHSIELVETPHVWANLARAWRRRGDLARSERMCRRALEMQPDHGPAMHALALALLAQRRFDDAVAAGLRASQLLAPAERRHVLYARLLVALDQRAHAVAILRAWLAQEPGNVYAAHQLAACTGEDTPERASDAYVATVFDHFADAFERTLAGLKYCAPERVAEALAAVLPAPAAQFDVADLGCGTGLCGPLLKPWSRRLAGCDLSAEMLRHAAARGVYDTLDRAELTAFLDARPEGYDVVVSADTLIYFGDLAGVARAVRRALRPGGRFAFSLEAMAASEPGEHVLRATGRYAHADGHVRRALAAAGLQLDTLVSATLREEVQVPVPGWIVTAHRPVDQAAASPASSSAS